MLQVYSRNLSFGIFHIPLSSTLFMKFDEFSHKLLTNITSDPVILLSTLFIFSFLLYLIISFQCNFQQVERQKHMLKMCLIYHEPKIFFNFNAIYYKLKRVFLPHFDIHSLFLTMWQGKIAQDRVKWTRKAIQDYATGEKG